MVFATAGWSVWWLAVLGMRLVPTWKPSFDVVSWVASGFAVVGLALAVFTVRGRRGWVVLAMVPIFANGSLLALPSLLRQVGLEIDARRPAGDGENPEGEETSPRSGER